VLLAIDDIGPGGLEVVGGDQGLLHYVLDTLDVWHTPQVRTVADDLNHLGGEQGCLQGAEFAAGLSGARDGRLDLAGVEGDLIADDGTAAFVAALDVLGTEGKPMSQIVDPLRRYVQSGEINSKVGDTAAVIEQIRSEHADAPEVSTLDGLLVRYGDWWFNLRPSNTEPVLRLNLEADTQEKMETERDAMLARIAELG